MTNKLPQDFINKVLEYDAKRGGGSKSVRPQVFLEVFIRELGPYLSLPKHEECTACYGKGKYSVYKGDAVAGVDFPGDKPFVVEQGGVKEFPCPKCKGKQEQEDKCKNCGGIGSTQDGFEECWACSKEQEDTTPIEKIQELDLAKLNLPLRGSIDALYKKQKEIIDTVNSLISKQTNE